MNWWLRGLSGRKRLGDQGELVPGGDQSREALRSAAHPEHALPRVREQPTGKREETQYPAVGW